VAYERTIKQEIKKEGRAKADHSMDPRGESRSIDHDDKPNGGSSGVPWSSVHELDIIHGSLSCLRSLTRSPVISM
jgi:hypothetical protein